MAFKMKLDLLLHLADYANLRHSGIGKLKPSLA